MMIVVVAVAVAAAAVVAKVVVVAPAFFPYKQGTMHHSPSWSYGHMCRDAYVLVCILHGCICACLHVWACAWVHVCMCANVYVLVCMHVCKYAVLVCSSELIFIGVKKAGRGLGWRDA